MSTNHDIDLSLTSHRRLHAEALEERNLLAADFDDALGEAIPLGPATQQGAAVAAEISEPMDVDMYSLAIGSGQTVDIDVDTPLNGPGGLGGYLRLFNDQGIQVAANNDGAAPEEGLIGFDPYLRFAANQGGIFYIGISSYQNTAYDPLTGEGDSGSEQFATGNYTLRVTALPEFTLPDVRTVPPSASGANQAAPMVMSPNAPVDGGLSTDSSLTFNTLNLGGLSSLGLSSGGANSLGTAGLLNSMNAGLSGSTMLATGIDSGMSSLGVGLHSGLLANDFGASDVGVSTVGSSGIGLTSGSMQLLYGNFDTSVNGQTDWSADNGALQDGTLNSRSPLATDLALAQSLF